MIIKKLLLPFFFIFPLILSAQMSLSAEYILDPFYSFERNQHEDFEEDRSIIKEISIAANYELTNFLSLRTGVARLDKRNASSYLYFFQDDVIPGQVPQIQNLTLRHRSGIRSYSAFLGVQFDFDRLHLLNQIHYALGVFKDPAIVGREYSSSTGMTIESYYDIRYENISFIKADLSLVYDLLVSQRGAISLVLKYAKDFTADRMFTVSDYDPDLREMVENFPGSSYYDLDEFLEGGPLYYDRELWGVGLRMSYKLGTRANDVD